MYEKIRIKIGKNLAAIRTKKGLTIKELSLLSGVSESTILKIETTTKNFRLVNLIKIVTVLDVKNKDIF